MKKYMKKIIILAMILVFFSYMAYCFFENRNTYNIFTIKQKIIDEIVDRFDNGLLTEYDKRTKNRMDLFGNPVGSPHKSCIFSGLAFSKPALQKCDFISKLFRN